MFRLPASIKKLRSKRSEKLKIEEALKYIYFDFYEGKTSGNYPMSGEDNFPDPSPEDFETIYSDFRRYLGKNHPKVAQKFGDKSRFNEVMKKWLQDNEFYQKSLEDYRNTMNFRRQLINDGLKNLGFYTPGTLVDSYLIHTMVTSIVTNPNITNPDYVINSIIKFFDILPDAPATFVALEGIAVALAYFVYSPIGVKRGLRNIYDGLRGDIKDRIKHFYKPEKES